MIVLSFNSLNSGFVLQIIVYCSIASDRFSNLRDLFSRYSTEHIFVKNQETSSPKVFVFQKFVFEDGGFETTNHLFAQVYLSSASQLRRNLLLITVPD